MRVTNEGQPESLSLYAQNMALFTESPTTDRYGNSRFVMLENGASPSPEDVRSRMETFAAGSAETVGLVLIRTIPPLIEGEGANYTLWMQPEFHAGVPDIRRVRPPMGSPGAQSMMHDAATLLGQIEALPFGDERALELAARMACRIMAALPDQRGAGARAHLLAWAALASRGFLLGPIQLTGPEDGFTTNPLTGRREYAFYNNFLDSQIHLESEAEFVDRFEGRFQFIDRLSRH